MHTNFLAAIRTRPVIADGAMGTQLFSRGVQPASCVDHVTLTAPDLVREVHTAYLAAGAEVIETNTFGANRVKLARFGLDRLAREINLRGAALARECAGGSAWVAGAMGPLGRLDEPLAPDAVREAFSEQALALAEGGADLIILETFADLGQLLLALAAVKQAVGLPVAAQMVFTPAGTTLDGHAPADCLARLLDAGADLAGLNCGVGPKGGRDILTAASRARPTGPFSVFPNAGFPERLEDRLIWPSSPDYFGRTLAECVPLGARLLGGCCGTGPEHIAALRRALAGEPKTPRAPRVEATAARPPAPAAAAQENRFAQRLRAGERMFLVELDPPKHMDVSATLAAAEALAEAGIDAITVADNPLSSPRLCNIALAGLIRTRTGAEVVVHMTGRDRNLIGLQSAIMGLASQGLFNVLAVTGDPPPQGGEERISGVFDVRSFELITLLKGFVQGRNASGQDMKAKPPFCVGGAFNPNTRDITIQVGRMRRKIERGAEYFLTQPVYSLEKVDLILEATRDVKTPIFLGIMPLASHRNAEYLHNEFPGISIPDEIRERMRKAGDQGAAEGIEIAWELMARALPHFAGIYIMPPFNRHAAALELVRRARAASGHVGQPGATST
ncbi:MAG: bifunctional homocysteine S-methyltransferase/methylenetetrahydrofolate reductase [Desulfocurvibacter africanus]